MAPKRSADPESDTKELKSTVALLVQTVKDLQSRLTVVESEYAELKELVNSKRCTKPSMNILQRVISKYNSFPEKFVSLKAAMNCIKFSTSNITKKGNEFFNVYDKDTNELVARICYIPSNVDQVHLKNELETMARLEPFEQEPVSLDPQRQEKTVIVEEDTDDTE